MFGMVPYRKRNNDLARSFFGDDFFDNFFGDNFLMGQSSGIKADIKENEKEYVIEAEIPGVNKEAIDVELRDNYLTISANHSDEINEEKENYIRRERRIGRLSRSFYVQNVNRENVKASYKDGILNLVIPKEKEQAPSNYKIDIN
jgi:HSP20 family protein